MYRDGSIRPVHDFAYARRRGEEDEIKQVVVVSSCNDQLPRVVIVEKNAWTGRRDMVEKDGMCERRNLSLSLSLWILTEFSLHRAIPM